MDARQQRATEKKATGIIHDLTASKLTDEGLCRVIALAEEMKQQRALLAATGSRNPQTEAAVTEKTLRDEGRIHGSEAYQELRLGVPGEIPPISPELAALCAAQPVKSMLVLDAGFSLIDLAKASESGWRMDVTNSVRLGSFASHAHDIPAWVIVPMEISTEPETRGLPKTDAVQAVQDNLENKKLTISAPDPRLMALGVLLHERATGEKLLWNIFTLTSISNVIVGDSYPDCFEVRIRNFTVVGYGDNVGLAPIAEKR